MMKKRISSRYRSLLARGGAVFAILFLLFCETGCHNSKDTETIVIQPITMTEVSTTCTTSTTMFTTTTSTTSSTSTKTTTTTMAETTSTSTTTQTMTVPQSTAPINVEIATEPVCVSTELPITDQEFALIANVISHEAGSSWISEYERACIVACIMNRVADPRFPSTIDGVVHQPYQMFDVPYYRIDYSGIGYEPIDNAIYAYFNGTYNCGSINSWTGDGKHNYFYYQ